jgi:hypothetical protein
VSRLELYGRPLVAFDPSNKKHRQYFADFLKYRGWGRCPVRFIVPDDVGFDLPTLIKNQLLAYYMGREFGKDPDIEKPWVWSSGEDQPQKKTRK